MVKFTNLTTRILIFLISLLCLFYFFIFAFQKSVSKPFISSLLESTNTSQLLVNYSNKDSKLITIKDYISKSLDVFGVKENEVSKDIIENYIESLTDSILSDVIFNYINNEKMVINTNYEEVSELSKFIPSRQKEKLKAVIEDINLEIINYMDNIFEESKELKYVKIVNNFHVNYLLLVIIILILFTLFTSKCKLKTMKSYICILLIFVIILLVLNIIYSNIFQSMFMKMEKYGNSFQIFFNTFKDSLLYIWKYLVIILVIFSILYIVIKQFSKKMST